MKFNLHNFLSIVFKSLFVSIIMILYSCSGSLSPGSSFGSLNLIDEVEPKPIKLNGILSEDFVEASGLDWYGDYLIVLPQYPHKTSNVHDGAIFAIKKSDIINYIDGVDTSALNYIEVPFIASGLDEIGKAEGSGYEAISFNGNQVFVSIENFDGDSISSYFVQGEIFGDLDSLVLDKNSKIAIKSNSRIKNMGEEAMVHYNNNVYCIHEANGANVVSLPVCAEIDLSNKTLDYKTFPVIEYRITDASEADSEGNFWVINYLYPGDKKKLTPGEDYYFDNYGIGKTNKQFDPFERLIQLKIENGKIVRTDIPPVYLKLSENKGRNWEGLVKLDGYGFILITDYYPGTVMAFAKYPSE